ncbi:MAG: sulfite exporter TauE/SafE family protein [Methylococcales bacterium]
MTIKQFKIIGMHCSGCEEIISQAIKGLPGIRHVQASYPKALVVVDYDHAVLDPATISQQIEAKGYQIEQTEATAAGKIKPWLIFLLLLVVVGGLTLWGKSQMPAVMQQIKPQMTQSLLVAIGFLTGFHCIGMCGGFVVGYTNTSQSKARQLLAHLSYGFGKTMSYTILGAGFGLLGAVIAITPQIRAVAALAASVFLLLYGLKMLNIFAVLRRFTLRMPSAVNRQIAGGLRKQSSPLLTGLLTGLLLGCGPLQAMYVMAAGTGDPMHGAMILMLFGLGTLIPLLSFGFFASALPSSAMHQLVRVSGILVIVMGLVMAQRGWKMLHSAHPPMVQQMQKNQ